MAKFQTDTLPTTAIHRPGTSSLIGCRIRFGDFVEIGAIAVSLIVMRRLRSQRPVTPVILDMCIRPREIGEADAGGER